MYYQSLFYFILHCIISHYTCYAANALARQMYSFCHAKRTLKCKLSSGAWSTFFVLMWLLLYLSKRIISLSFGTFYKLFLGLILSFIHWNEYPSVVIPTSTSVIGPSILKCPEWVNFSCCGDLNRNTFNTSRLLDSPIWGIALIAEQFICGWFHTNG